MEEIDYSKMRYELDEDGYIYQVYFGCASGVCQAYEGNVPEGYETIEEWHEDNCEILNAWKIVDGNLVYDENKCDDIQALYEKQKEENQLSTHKWVNGRLKVSNSIVTDELASEANGTSLIVLDDAGNYEIPELKITSETVTKVKVISSNKNILCVDGISKTINGVEILVNGDRTITLNGTSTDVIEFDLNGSSSNRDILYLIKNNINYAISGLTDDVSLSLYSFDGIDRTLASTTSNGIINTSNSFKITQTILTIPSGVTFEYKTITPQIEIGEATEYVEHEETKTIGILEDNECVITELMSYSGKTVIMIDEEVNSSLKYYKNQILNEKFAEIKVTEEKIEQTVAEVENAIDRQNTSISQISQTVNEIKSSISDIAEITISAENNNGHVELDNINESEPIDIIIRPIGEHISYLYPSSGLYPTNEYAPATEGLVPSATLTPSSSLVPRTTRPAQDVLYPKSRTLRFYNKTTEETFDLELPGDLLFYDSENYDEFVLNYEDLSCVINKKVGYNADGSVYLLDEERAVTYEYPHLYLTDGDYAVTLLGYDEAYLFVRLMPQNIYTTQFATKAELNSEITLSKDSIVSEVNGKLDTLDDDINARLELKVDLDKLVSEINASADTISLTGNRLIVDANNLKISKDGTLRATNGIFEGKISSTEGKIGGFDLGTEKFTSDIVPSKNYTTSDATKVRSYLMGETTLTNAEIKLYDLNEDGKIDLIDYVRIQNLIKANVSTTEPGSLEINSKNPTKTLLIKDKDGNEIINLSLLGLAINGLNIESNLFYQPGETMDILDYVGFAGFLTGSAKSIHFTIPTEKSMANITSAELTSYNLDIRHADGGYLGTGITDIDGSITVTIVKNNLLDVYMNFNKAFSVTNNIPLSVAVNDLTITFN